MDRIPFSREEVTPASVPMRGSHHSRSALLFGIPIGLLGGLIGLGGAEFRLPILAGPLGYPARQAVALNLAITMATVLAALCTRGWLLSCDSVRSVGLAVLALMAGAILGAATGPTLAGRLSDRQFERVLVWLLVVLGGGLILDSGLTHEPVGVIDGTAAAQIGAGLLFGGAIGLVSSLLGVAGGELLIPTLVFVFGVDIKTGGTLSLLVSAPMVLVGLMAHARWGSFTDQRAWGETVVPMGVGSILGAIPGGLLANAVPASFLKVSLGAILIYSAGRLFRRPEERRTV